MEKSTAKAVGAAVAGIGVCAVVAAFAVTSATSDASARAADNTMRIVAQTSEPVQGMAINMPDTQSALVALAGPEPLARQEALLQAQQAGGGQAIRAVRVTHKGTESWKVLLEREYGEQIYAWVDDYGTVFDFKLSKAGTMPAEQSSPSYQDDEDYNEYMEDDEHEDDEHEDDEHEDDEHEEHGEEGDRDHDDD